MGASHYDERLARILDLIVASIALVLLSPLLVLVYLSILIESGRPVLFAQTRLGRHGRPFRMLKFRKFRVDACGTRPLTLTNDERLSHLGRILARTKLDELPQLFNVLRGEMAVVGPRPESFQLADCFTASTRAVLSHKPGIVGPTQVAFRNEAALFPQDADPTGYYRQVIFPMKARSDIAYYSRRTIGSDLKWLALSVLAVIGVKAVITGAMSGVDNIPPPVEAAFCPSGSDGSPAS